jgi:hypothetical protein
MMEIKILERHRDQVGAACQVALATEERRLRTRGATRLHRINDAQDHRAERVPISAPGIVSRRSKKLGFQGLV